MEDLMCLETVEQVPNTPQQFNSASSSTQHGYQDPMENYPIAAHDKNIRDDSRVLRNLLVKEANYVPSDSFLNPGMSHVNINIRKVLINWILDLCEHRDCELQVFFVAVNLLDRFLSTTLIQRNQLQLSACACMLIASKIRQCSYLSVELLAFYTEDSVSHEDIRQWEVLVLAKLAWDICPITTHDFVDPLIHLLPDIADAETVRNHALTFLALGHGEREFVSMPPSIMTAGALILAINGLNMNVAFKLERLANAIKCDPDDIASARDILDDYIVNFTRMQRLTQSASTVTSSNTGSNFLEDPTIAKSNKLKGTITPTDITNVEF